MPAKCLANADGPHHGHSRECQTLFNLVNEVERLARFAVHLVDEGDDGNVAHAADFEKLARAVFNALGPVDHHDGGINCRQRAIGVFREVFMARRVEQVEHTAPIFKRHHRGDNGNAARPFNAHPVGAGAAAVALGAHMAGQLDGTTEQQQLFGQAWFCRRQDGR